MSATIASISAQFAIPGWLVSVAPYGSGHINDTYLAVYAHEGHTARYVHQRINHRVFADPPAVMANIQRVTEHVRRKLSAAGVADVLRRTLTVVPTRRGGACLRSADGSYWRTYRHIEATCTHQTVEDPERAYQAARAFGFFQAQLADLPTSAVVETIPDFHNTPKRFAALLDTCAAAPPERLRAAERELAWATAHRELAGVLVELHAAGSVPTRITHNDTKLNNVLFEATTGEAVCVVDLDTVMPGLSLYDFGDMVRTMTCTAAEDETDLDRVRVHVPLFAAVARGYLESAGGMLNATECAHLVAAGELIVFEQAVRFLNDYLAGDVYYKVEHPGHNLERCRAQFALLRSLIQQEAELAACVRQLGVC